MAIPISNVTRRVVYEADGTGPYAFTFEILANTDIAVYKDDALLTLTTDYTVTIASNGTGSITLVASPTGADQIAIVGNRTIQRTTDFVTGGDFFANTVNNEMDQQTIFAQQNAEGLTRALQAPQTDPTTIDMTLPRASVRASKVLSFDASGNPSATEFIGSNRGNWASGTLYYVRDIVKDTSTSNIWQCVTQHTASGSQPLSTNTDSAKWFLLVDAASAGTSATNAANSATSAATSATNAASSATAAASSASSASTSASTATTKASEASTSATNASSSASTASTAATNASNSATAAATSATNASNSASAASTSASNASSSASSASTSASNASTSATNAASSATTATTKASEASTSATNAASSATASASSATAAAASAAAAAASFDAFDDIYLGAKSSDPSVDNDGNALTTGDQYFNTTANELRVYNGSTWQAASTVGGTVTSLSVTGATTLGQNPTLSGGTANGVAYLNGSKVLTSGSALTFDGGQLVINGAYATNADDFVYSYAGGTSGQRRAGFYLDGTNGQIRHYVNNAEAMRLTSTGLGIGTSSPANKLDVVGTAAFTYINSSGQGTSGVYLAGNSGSSSVTQFGGELRFSTGGTANTPATGVTERMRLDSSGNLGLGVTPSAWSAYRAFQMQAGSLLSYSTTDWRMVQNVVRTGATFNYLNNGFASYYLQDGSGGGHAWFTAPSGTAGNAITFTQAMTLDASGNLGVGTSSPTAISGYTALEINNATTGAILDLSQADTMRGRLVATTSSFTLETSGSIPVLFAPAGTERARIDSSGNLLVGTTTSSGDVTTKGVRIFANAKSVFTVDGDVVQNLVLANYNSTGSQTCVEFYRNSTVVGSIVKSAGATAYNTSSDYRLKENIAPMAGALEKVSQLKPCTYTWKETGNAGQGFIAHELGEVVPECVSGEKDAMRTEQYEISPAVPATYDEEGKELTPAVEAVMGEREVPHYQGIDTSFLVATLTAAIQEQQAIILAQQTALTALTARVAALESN